MSELVTSLANQILNEAPNSEVIRTLYEILDILPERSIPVENSWHPYGFLVTKLGNTEKDTMVRLHIWPSHRHIRQVPDWPIHCHSWALKSRIICGQAINEIYAVEADSERAGNQLYRVKFDNSSSIIEATNIPVRYHRVTRTMYQSGDTYSVTPGDYHSTNVSKNSFSSTIAVMFSPTNRPSYVIGERECEQTYSFKRDNCHQAEFIELISHLKRRIDNEQYGSA